MWSAWMRRATPNAASLSAFPCCGARLGKTAWWRTMPCAGFFGNWLLTLRAPHSAVVKTFGSAIRVNRPNGLRPALRAGFFHGDRLALGPGVVGLRLAADPALVHRLTLELVAGVGAEAEAVGGVVERGMPGEHAEDQRVAGAEF